jgi:hypothetical protein
MKKHLRFWLSILFEFSIPCHDWGPLQPNLCRLDDCTENATSSNLMSETISCGLLFNNLTHSTCCNLNVWAVHTYNGFKMNAHGFVHSSQLWLIQCLWNPMTCCFASWAQAHACMHACVYRCMLFSGSECGRKAALCTQTLFTGFF